MRHCANLAVGMVSLSILCHCSITALKGTSTKLPMMQLIKVAESLSKCVMAKVIEIEVGVGARVHIFDMCLCW